MLRTATPSSFLGLGAAALAMALLAPGAADASSAAAIPGPALEAAAAPGAYCLPRGDGGLGAAGFAGAVVAIAWVARRRSPSS